MTAVSDSRTTAKPPSPLGRRFRRACDGFVVAATHIPGAFEDFVRLVIPEPQRRGLYHREYEGLTLRENLGLGLP